MGQSFLEIIPMKSAGILLPSGTSLSKLLMEILWKLKLYIEGLILFLWVILLEKSEGIANIIADWKLRDDLAQLAVQKTNLVPIEMHKFAQSPTASKPGLEY